MTKADHQTVLEDAQRGDRRALETLLGRCRPYVRKLIRGASQRPDEDRLVNEILREAGQAFDRFPGKTVGEFLAWLRPLVLRIAGPTVQLRPAKGNAALRAEQKNEPATERAVDLPSAAPSPAAHDTWATLIGHAPPTQAPLPPKEEIGRYAVLEIIGSGGMGVVYKAYDPQLQRTVAIKVPRFEQPGRVTQESRLRFLREARAAAAIRHAHICPIYDVGEHAGTPYVVMAFVAGQSLAGRLSERAQLEDPRQVVRLMREIAEALAAVHAHGIIHRDLKPGNILLDSAGHALLTDFGLSRFECDVEHLTEEGTLTGTPAYMAPEQARCEKVDARSDLFSLGSILYQLCTGALPFKGHTTAAVLIALALDTPTPPIELNPELSPPLADLAMQLLTKDPTQRPQSAQAVVERLQIMEHDLAEGRTLVPTGRAVPTQQKIKPVRVPPPRPKPVEAVAAGHPVPRPASMRQPPARKPRRRSRWQWPLASVAAGVVVAVLATVVSVWLCVPFAASTLDRDAGRNQTGALVGAKPLPLKIVLMAGQTNMSGPAAIATLDRLATEPQHRWMLSKIKNTDGSWKVRSNVWVSYEREPGFGYKHGPLSVGFGERDHEFGPELMFGHTLGDAVANPILLVKITQGPLRLAVEGRPPGSSGGFPPGPFFGRMMRTIHQVTANPKAYFPDYAGQGCEIAGFVWFQGWNDHLDPNLAAQYENHLTHLVHDVRRHLGTPGLPVVIGSMGIGGRNPNAQVAVLRKAQLAAMRRPEMAFGVTLVDTAPYWDDAADALARKGFDIGKNRWFNEAAKKQFDKMGSKPEFLYLGSGLTFARIGHGFGEAMNDLWQGKKR